MSDKQRAGPFETLGAWLRIWTPPRDVEVPPIPWRKVAAGGVVLALIGVAVAIFVAPEIDEGKREGAAQEARERERTRAAQRARIEREQRPRWGDLPRGATRAEAVAAVGDAIGRDARARYETEDERALCEPVPGVDAAAPTVLYDCHAKVRDIVGAGDTRGALTLPYRASIRFADDRYAFCRIFPRPGERWIEDPRDAILMPRVCSLYRTS
jgi:hypothetical protein